MPYRTGMCRCRMLVSIVAMPVEPSINGDVALMRSS